MLAQLGHRLAIKTRDGSHTHQLANKTAVLFTIFNADRVALVGHRVQGLIPVNSRNRSHRTAESRPMKGSIAHIPPRRCCLQSLVGWVLVGGTCCFGLAGMAHGNTPLQTAMRRAEKLRDEAVRAGDQPYGAVVLRGEQIVGEAPSRVVTHTDPTAHAEMEAIRDAARRLRTRNLADCWLVSTSHPCRMCEAAARWAGIERMVHGETLTDAGRPK